MRPLTARVLRDLRRVPQRLLVLRSELLRRVVVAAALLSAILCGLVVFTALFGPVVSACSIPVFRYALERWERDAYEVTVFHRGPLAPEDAASLRAFGARPAEQRANARVRLLDVSGDLDEASLRLWRSQGTVELPWMTLQYPRSFGPDTALWAGPLGERSVESLLDSPARREIVRRILKGDCAVWIILECGNAEKDEAAASLLEAELAELEKTLRLPELDPWDFGAESEEDLPELRAAFSTVRVKRTDPQEAILRAMLLASEEDLTGLDEPMAFPVFGRGRVLCALVGKGINRDNVLDICSFLVGPCSCIVKAQNPGVDLLTSVDWDGVLEGRFVIDEHLPPLVGLSGFADEAARPAGESDTGGEDRGSAAEDKNAGSGTLLRNTTIALAAGVALVVAFSIVAVRRRKG